MMYSVVSVLAKLLIDHNFCEIKIIFKNKKKNKKDTSKVDINGNLFDKKKCSNKQNTL